MPAKEIKELRQSGKIEEALNMAKAELAAEPDNVWAKRNISWVYYDYLKQNIEAEKFNLFMNWLNELKKLQLPAEEKMLFEQLSWLIGKMAFNLSKVTHIENVKGQHLFDTIRTFNFPKPSEGFSFLFKALHKFLKDADNYIQFADWWDFKNFTLKDFETDKLPNGKEVMSIAEQAHIAYAKHLLPKKTFTGEIIFDVDKANSFLPKLEELCDKHPKMQYPPYFNAKLLLAVGDKNDALAKLLPFARKKRNDFWVWDILAELFSNEDEKFFSCYCRALLCTSPEEMLTKLRQKLASNLIEKKLFDEAKTEIESLLKVKKELGHNIPSEVINWINTDWFKQATQLKNNFLLYKNNSQLADDILFADVPAEKVFVEFVNSDKKILNFITKDNKKGFFKYDRFITKVELADVLSVRFKDKIIEELNQVYTVNRINDKDFEAQFIREIEGEIRIADGKNFGFLNDIYIHPSIITNLKISNKEKIKVKALKSYNKEKKEWGWKANMVNKI
jgi:hypothetical protein